MHKDWIKKNIYISIGFILMKEKECFVCLFFENIHIRCTCLKCIISALSVTSLSLNSIATM